jgi:hypothetical protein
MAFTKAPEVSSTSISSRAPLTKLTSRTGLGIGGGVVQGIGEGEQVAVGVVGERRVVALGVGHLGQQVERAVLAFGGITQGIGGGDHPARPGEHENRISPPGNTKVPTKGKGTRIGRQDRDWGNGQAGKNYKAAR